MPYQVGPDKLAAGDDVDAKSAPPVALHGHAIDLEENAEGSEK